MRRLCRLNRSGVGIDSPLLADSKDMFVGSRRLLGGSADLFTTFPLTIVISLVVLRGLAEDDRGFDDML